MPEPADMLDEDERAALAEEIERNLAPLGPHVRALDGVRALANPGATCVVTGQQPGFLGGPLYNVYKALHAVRLASLLSEAWKRPVVPVFWNHADDHDVAEVHHLHVVNPNLDLRKIALPGLSSGKRPLSELTLHSDRHRLGPIAELLRQILPETEHLDETIERFLPLDGESLARAFTRAYTDLFGHLGLVVIEPDWIRDPLSRALAALIGLDPRAALARGAEDLAAAGHEVPIDPDQAALVFHHIEGKRMALRSGEGGFRYDDEPGSRTPAELAAEILQDPKNWSAGALLRPLVQDRALPVAAYIGGLGELAYHASLPPLREQAGLPQTPFIPRLSATLIDAEVRASLTRLEISVKDALTGAARPEGSVETTPIAGRLRQVAARTSADLADLNQELQALDRGLSVQLKRTAKQVADLVEKLAGKADRVHANKTGKGHRHLRRVESYLRPRGGPQERTLGALQFIARHGTAWLTVLLAELDPFPSEHVVLDLSSTMEGP